MISIERKKDSKSSCVKNNLSGFVSRAWEIVLDALRDIEVFGPEA